MDTQEILLLITLIVTSIIGILGFTLTIIQIHLSNKVKNAEFISKILENLRFNQRSLDVIYLIEYDQKWYNEKFHGSGELEKNIDAFFSQINYVCYLQNKKLLSDNNFQIFKYEILRICNNYQCKCYLWNLYHWSKRNNSNCSFDYLIKYLKTQFSIEALNKFENSNSNISGYVKYLNF